MAGLLQSKSNNLKKKGKTKAGKTTQSTVRYVECYENGVIQVEPGFFSKTFNFSDFSFKTKSDAEQEAIFSAYQRFLNSLSAGEDFYFTVANVAGDKTTSAESVIPPLTGDSYDPLRKEMAVVMKNKIKASRNNIITLKYLTATISGDDVEKVMRRFDELTSEVENGFKKITGETPKALSLAERLELLSIIMNGRENVSYWFEHQIDGSVKVDWKAMARQNLTTKDIICPEIMKFKRDIFQIGGERYGQAMYLDKIANWMNTNFLSEISETNFESVITMHIQPILQQDALKLVHNKSVNVTSEIMTKQKNLGREGYSSDMVPLDLKLAKEQVDGLQDDLMSRDQRLFYMSMSVCHFDESESAVRENSKIMKNLAAKFMCELKPLQMQQERGLMSCLPFGRDELFVKKLLTTEALAVFIPFNEANTLDKGGFYYGTNAINKSIIVLNRLRGMNYNGLVLGASGSGKSFSAKREMISAIMNTNNSEIFIIDPDNDYTPLADAFGGTVVKIAPGNGVYINPFDLDIDNGGEADYSPLATKIDFVCGMLETMIGSGARLTPTQKSIVDRCVRQIYKPYLEHLAMLPPDEKTGRRITIDRDACPTMQTLLDTLSEQPQPEAQNLALVMEPYASGTYDTFAHRTNVDLDTRVVVYNIFNIGENLKDLGLKICLNDVWNKVISNRRKNKWTWFYVDEFHLLLSNASTSSFIKSIWKRARKFQGVPTGITQNVEDLLQSPDARAILNNTSFVYLLNQAQMDRVMLKELLNLSANDIEYISDVESGHGLIKTTGRVIPFEDNFPSDTKLYTIMSTKPKDAE